MKTILRAIRNTRAFAFCQGFYECWRYGDACGRTHATDQGWNDAYDRGMNAAERTRHSQGE